MFTLCAGFSVLMHNGSLTLTQNYLLICICASDKSHTLFKFYVRDLHLAVLVRDHEPHVLCILCIIRLGCPMIIGETGNVGT